MLFLSQFTEHKYARRAFLNHSGGDITDHYIGDSALGELQRAEQDTISALLAKALGSPRGLG